MAVDAVKKQQQQQQQQQQTDAGPETETTIPITEPLASILDDSPITISSYIGIQSIVFNHSKLGYYLERGGYSF